MPSWIFIVLSSIKQQSVGRHVSPLRNIILIQSQSCFALTPSCCMFNRGATNTNFIVLVWPDWGSNSWSIILQARMLTITQIIYQNYQNNLQMFQFTTTEIPFFYAYMLIYQLQAWSRENMVEIHITQHSITYHNKNSICLCKL